MSGVISILLTKGTRAKDNLILQYPSVYFVKVQNFVELLNFIVAISDLLLKHHYGIFYKHYNSLPYKEHITKRKVLESMHINKENTIHLDGG